MNHHSIQVTPDGLPINERATLHGLHINIVAGALGMVWAAMTQTMPLTMFMEALGATGVFIGLVSALPQLLLIVQVPTAFFAERFKSRKKLWAPTILVSRLLWLMPALYLALFPKSPSILIWSTVAVAAVSAILARSVDALWFSWMADLVPEHMRGRFWGTRQSLTTVSFVLAMALAGHILDTFPPPKGDGGSWIGFSLVFVLGSIFGAADIIVHLFVPEPRPMMRREAMHWIQRIREPLRDPDFRRLTMAMSVYTFAVGLTALGIVYLKENFHVSYTHLSLLGIVASVSTIVFSFAWGYALDRMGGRAFGAIMVILAPLAMTVWFFVRDYNTNLVNLCQGVWGLGVGVAALVKLLPAGMEAWVNGLILPQSIWLVLFANVFAGALFGGIALCQLSLAAALVPEKGRTMAMAVYWSTIGLVGSLGLLAAGWVMDYFHAHPIPLVLPNGTPMAFHHVLVIGQMVLLWTGVLPPLLAIRKRAGEPGVGAAFSQLLLANPFRMASNIYTMGASVTSGLRARAVHSLGEDRARIAVSDLIERLDDASVEVREEAAYALGSIGSPEAIDALLLRLEDKDSDLAPQIARALRYAKILEREKTVPALLKKLKDPDRETKTETARTLGRIGDRRAVPSLMDVLSESRDAKVVSASSEALSRLGEVAAIYAILPRMKEAGNPVLKRSLAVAIGDLLGEPEGFYKVLTKEQYRRGSEVERLLKDLKHDIEKISRERMQVEGQKLAQKTILIQRLYDAEDFAECAVVLFDLAIGLAALRWGVEVGSDAKAFIEEMVWRDQRFGVTVWYLDLLRKGWNETNLGNRDFVDVLLGIYSLICRGTAK